MGSGEIFLAKDPPSIKTSNPMACGDVEVQMYWTDVLICQHIHFPKSKQIQDCIGTPTFKLTLGTLSPSSPIMIIHNLVLSLIGLEHVNIHHRKFPKFRPRYSISQSSMECICHDSRLTYGTNCLGSRP